MEVKSQRFWVGTQQHVMKGLIATTTCVLAALGANAVYVDDAYRVDWIQEQVGQVSASNAFVSDDVLAALTSKNVLAGINVTDGRLLWRKQFDDDASFARVKVQDKDLAVLGLKDRVSTWDPKLGHLKLQEFVSEGEIRSVYGDAADPERVIVEFGDGSVKAYNLFTREWTSAKKSSANKPASSEVVEVDSERRVVQQSNGQLQMVKGEKVLWSREEGLADAVDGVFVDLPEIETSLSAEELVFEENADVFSAYVRRVQRHLNDLKYLPDYVLSKLSLEDHQQDTRDEIFGFRKLFVVATKQGRLIALNTAVQGRIEWAIDDIHAVQLATVRETIYALTSEGTLTAIDGVLGQIVPDSAADNVHDGLEFVQLTPSAIAVWTNAGTIVNVVGETQQPLYLTKEDKASSSVQGYVYQDDKVVPTWTFNLDKGYTTVASAKRGHQVVASIGTILGDRSVLYKYLHENSLAVAGYNPETQTLKICVIDTVTGRTLHCKEHNENVVNPENVKLVFGEYWIVYTYYSAKPTPGQKLVVWDMYESGTPNERINKDASYSSFESFPLPHVKAQSFLLPSKVDALGISRTKFGVTSRDVIVSLSTGQILSLPKRLLDARRPVGRDPTKEELGEGLVKYEPFIGIVEHAVISHFRQALVNYITTTGAALESTSLVVGYGNLDVFFTRVTPSMPFDVLNSKFGKTKLLYTIAALIAIVSFLRPIVNRKAVNAIWR